MSMQPRHRVPRANVASGSSQGSALRITTPIASSPLRRERKSKISPLTYAVPLIVLGAFLKFMIDTSTIKTVQPNHVSPSKQNQTPLAITAVKQEFYERYGGKEMAEQILSRGIDSFGSTRVTAERMVRAVAQERPFVVAFAGYSVTVGRGNHFEESFPFVMERILAKPFEKTLNQKLSVKNAAIGGIPSFPYGWCLEHFMGDDADVISWDYGMNEGNGASIMESYLRHGMQLSNRPMFILLDSNRQRKSLLQKYAEMNIVRDAISVARADAVLDKTMLEKPDEEKPVGLRRWNEFGAPNGCPGRSSWHPKKMEHELIGWMIAMHLLQAMEQAHDIIMTDPNWKQTYGKDQSDTEKISFPAPLHKPPQNDESVTQLMYGHATDDNQYVMKDISCRTSFLPASDSERVLPSVVVSGIAQTDVDMMQERDDALYKSGWVLDVSKVERDTKKKVEKCGGFGYIDMKVALYGIPESGPLRLWLPYEGSVNDKNSLDARDWFDDLIICEANEKRDEKACQLDKDMEYIVGGVKVPAGGVSSIDGAGVYLKRRTCYNVGIPANAKITRLADVRMVDEADLTPGARSRLVKGNNAQDSDVGLVIDISIPGADVSRANGACCVSHIIWEQH